MGFQNQRTSKWHNAQVQGTLIANKFHQMAGFDFNETFSPIVKPTTTKIILTIALPKAWIVM